MSYSIIIPSKDWNNLSYCLAAIHKHEPKSRVIVVDDGLEVRPQSFEGMEITVIDGVKPFVFAVNVNAGLRVAFSEGHDCAIACNDDALLESDWGFHYLAQAALEHPEYGVVGAVTNVTGQPLQKPQRIGLREVRHIAFICVAIPKRTVDKIGFLDTRYRIDYGVEDRDYCEACERAGLKTGVLDSCYVDHGSLHSTFRGDPRMPKDYRQNYALFKQKWGIA